MSANPEQSRPRVVLGVSGGIAAYKACELLRLFTESGHDVTVVPTAVGAGVRRRADVGGPVGQAGAHRGLGRRPRGAARAPGADRRPRGGRARDGRHPREGGPRPRRRPADQHPADRALPGCVRPGDAHRDVGAPGDRRQRRDAARAGRPGDRAGRGPAHRCRHRQGSAARAGGDLRGRDRRARPGRGREPPARTSPAATWWSPPAAPGSTSTRCGSSATVPRACRATPWPAPRSRAVPR